MGHSSPDVPAPIKPADDVGAVAPDRRPGSPLPPIGRGGGDARDHARQGRLPGLRAAASFTGTMSSRTRRLLPLAALGLLVWVGACIRNTTPTPGGGGGGGGGGGAPDAGLVDDAGNVIPEEDAGFTDDDAGFTDDDAGFPEDDTGVAEEDAGMGGESSCVGNCGGQAPSGCYCDDGCPDPECCADWAAVCMGGGPMIDPRMSFFVPSRRMQRGGADVAGGNLGGLAGADAFCAQLAREALPGDTKTWRAYLSTSTENARDRIGAGPWFNARGDMVAANVQALHDSPPPRARMLTERGGDPLDNGGRHDMMTGSKPDGTRFASLAELMPYFVFPDGSFEYPSKVFDATCANWTSDGNPNNQQMLESIQNYVVVGHVDWDEINSAEPRSRSWNASHVTACDLASMELDLGDTRVYCFAQ
jgi:hypothetical protein